MKSMVLVSLISLFLAACGTPPVVDKPEVWNQSEEYQIGVGDQIQVGVWKNPELSVNVPVRPDGKISVPLVGDLVASGHTAEELSAQVAKSLKDYIRSPQVTVIITNPASAEFLRRVRITGAVNSPQSIPHRQGMTVLDIVLLAGGATPFALQNSAQLYRKTPDGLKVYPVYLENILEKGDLETNYVLMPSDIVTIPERPF
ncbi:MAG: polysaccharide biosynthesis/export family protein [Exilibacterium sp.]